MHKENDYLFIPQLNDQYTYINKRKKKCTSLAFLKMIYNIHSDVTLLVDN